MKLNLFLLFLTGLVPVTVSVLLTVPHHYDLMMTLKTWTDAQNYCRMKYTDLATVLSNTDWLQLEKEAASKGLTTSAWVGLYNDINSWRWSLNDLPLKNVPYTNWGSEDPNNNGGKEACGVIDGTGLWFDLQCTGLRPFICYDASFSGAARFIGISSPMTWPQAQTYCRTHHTDLASALNSSDNDMLLQVVKIHGTSWIGHYRDTWKWSDGTNASNIPWAPGQPDNAGGNENCAVVNNGLFYDAPCTDLNYFFCHTPPPVRQQQIMRMEVKSDGSVLDPAVQSFILDQIKQKLKEKGMLENTTVTWKVQPDGNIFHKKKEDL